MPRKGKALERLTALIESLLVPMGGTVTSPAYLPDKVTGNRREVDIAIRLKVGTSPILVIVECRDRYGIEDVTWIEQLAQKRNDVNADKAVAVSSYGFSQPAIRKAEFYNIEIRKLDMLTAADVQDWFRAGSAEHVSENAFIHGVKIQVQDVGQDQLTAQIHAHLHEISRGNIDQKFLISKPDKQPCSIRDVWEIQRNLLPIFGGIPETNTKIRRKVKINFPDPKTRYFIPGRSELIDVVNLIFDVDLSIDRAEIPIRRIHSYSDVVSSLVQTVEYEAGGGILSIHKDSQSGNRYVTFRPADDRDENKTK